MMDSIFALKGHSVRGMGAKPTARQIPRGTGGILSRYVNLMCTGYTCTSRVMQMPLENHLTFLLSLFLSHSTPPSFISFSF